MKLENIYKNIWLDPFEIIGIYPKRGDSREIIIVLRGGQVVDFYLRLDTEQRWEEVFHRFIEKIEAMRGESFYDNIVRTEVDEDLEANPML